MLYVASRASNLIRDTASKEMLLLTDSCRRALGSLEEPRSTVGVWIRKRSQVTALKTCLWGSELTVMLAVMNMLAVTISFQRKPPNPDSPRWVFSSSIRMGHKKHLNLLCLPEQHSEYGKAKPDAGALKIGVKELVSLQPLLLVFVLKGGVP